MIKDLKTRTQQGVFTIDCPKCEVTSFIGFTCTDKTFEDTSHGLMALARRRDGILDTNAIPDWVHCPACDETLNSGDHDLADIITDTTQVKVSQ